MTKNTYILVVDDEKTIREVVRRYLEQEGYSVKEAEDGYMALDFIGKHPPSLIVLDLMLPGMDGMSLTKHIRENHSIPIIMLTSKGEPVDRIRGLDLGADDYITKPFSPQELVSRVRAVLRRSISTIKSTDKDPIIIKNIIIDQSSRTVLLNNEEKYLTVKEFDLLTYFASNINKVFTRNQLLSQIWEDELFTDPSTVTVHIRRLREKIESDPSHPRHILTVWGVGYKFVENV
jgi:DNA-binding response OmpR family regulator